MTALKNIEDRLKTITDEVGELHPLLRQIFARNEDIARFEYTHGPDEMGADFIVVRNHEILKTQEYIGVIAKVGKIHQDLARINEQISECLKVRRLIEGGRKEIQLSEVWVVATSTITGGARRKINAAHAGSKIHFLSGSDLAALANAWVPEYWSELPVEVASYLADLGAEAKDADARHDLVHIEGQTFHIDQDILRVEIDAYRPDRARRRTYSDVDFLEEIERESVLLIEAGMGGGKSKLIRKLIQQLADPSEFPDRPWLPVSTSYRILLGQYDGSLSRLYDEIVPARVREHLPDGTRTVFFVDALDEKEEDQEDLISNLDSLVEEAGRLEGVSLVLTSRPIGSIEFDQTFRSKVASYTLKRLSIGQIAKYLEMVCSKLNLTTRIIDDLRKSPLYARLPQSPLAAVLLAQILRENPQDLPSTLPELYAKYMELATGRWDQDKGLKSQQEYQATSATLMDLAEYVLENELDSVATTEYKDRIEQYLRDRNLKVDAKAVFAQAVRRSEVLIPSRDGHTVSFKHRSFAEFLYAQKLIRDGQLAPSLRAFEMYWGNVYFFGCGLQKDSPDLIAGLANLSPESEQHRWLKPLYMANLTLAAYATPYSVIEETVYSAVSEMAELFCDIAEGRLPSFFSQLSRMDLLFIIQLMVRDHYGFEFLAPALEHAALRVNEESETQVAPYALFLLSVAYIDASDEGDFDFLLEQYDTTLPLDLSLGLVVEGHSRGIRSKLLKRHAKRLGRKLNASQATRHLVDSMHRLPLARLLPDTQDES